MPPQLPKLFPLRPHFDPSGVLLLSVPPPLLTPFAGRLGTESGSQTLAFDPGVTPKEGGLPGLGVLRDVVGSINMFAIIAVVAALAVAGVMWAWGSHAGSHQAEANGKKGVLISVAAALLLGGANGIVAFFSALGTKIQ